MIPTILTSPSAWFGAAVLAAMIVSSPATAEGGKERKQSPVFDSDGNVSGIVDPNVTCTSFTDQSGQTVYFCEPAETDED